MTTYEVTFTHVWTETFEADTPEEALQLAEDRREAHEAIGTGTGRVVVGLVQSQEHRLEAERKEAEYKAWKATQEAALNQHYQLEKRRDGTYECHGCLRTEDNIEAFLDTCCLNWALDLLEYSAQHEAGEHRFTTSVQVGDGPMGPEVNIYDRSCPRCIDERMRAGKPATSSVVHRVPRW